MKQQQRNGHNRLRVKIKFISIKYYDFYVI